MSNTPTPVSHPLAQFTPQRDFFIGIDSDGCAIDQMTIKHYECFAPAYIKAFDLQPISTIARETALFVNLFSQTRGINRWASIDRFFDLLKKRPEVIESGIQLPVGEDLKQFLSSGMPLSESGITTWLAQHPSAEIEQCIKWGKIVNELVAWMVHNTQPFPGVRNALEAMCENADTMVVSAASLDMLHHEWDEHDLAKYVQVIAGQEWGTKSQHIDLFAKGRYRDDHILLIGDAPGDGKTAAEQGILWYPILPGDEARSWERFTREALPRFFAEEYAGEYQLSLIEEYSSLLPSTVPWVTIDNGRAN
ncbi:HAD family hydrolase [Arcanobacterium canis]